MREFALLGREEYRAPVAVSQQFRNANNSIGGRASTSCENRDPGNPYDEQTEITKGGPLGEQAAPGIAETTVGSRRSD